MSDIPNHQRLARLVPLLYGVVMIHVDTFADWSSASSYWKSQAIGALFAAVVITLGVVLWFVLAPNEYAA